MIKKQKLSFISCSANLVSFACVNLKKAQTACTETRNAGTPERRNAGILKPGILKPGTQNY